MRVEEQLWWQDDTSKLLKNDPVSWKTMIEAMISAGFLKSGKPEDFYTDAIVVQAVERFARHRPRLRRCRLVDQRRPRRSENLTHWSNVNRV